MQYEKPIMDVIELEVEDIVCASGGGLNNGGFGDNEEGDGWL